jgi:hypothetical protein
MGRLTLLQDRHTQSGTPADHDTMLGAGQHLVFLPMKAHPAVINCRAGV